MHWPTDAMSWFGARRSSHVQLVSVPRRDKRRPTFAFHSICKRKIAAVVRLENLGYSPSNNDNIMYRVHEYVWLTHEKNAKIVEQNDFKQFLFCFITILSTFFKQFSYLWIILRFFFWFPTNGTIA